MMKNFFLFLVVTCFVLVSASADTLDDTIAGGGSPITKKIRSGTTAFHSATGTVSLDNAVDMQDCESLDIWFNPDFTGTDVTATYTLFNCPRKTASADYASECIGANFDPDGGGADTNIMTDANDSLHIWNLRVRFFGATITAGGFTAQATIRCL